VAKGLTEHIARVGSPYVTALAEAKLEPGDLLSVPLRFDPPASGGLEYGVKAVVDTVAP
jgi:hypothetical protein